MQHGDQAASVIGRTGRMSALPILLTLLLLSPAAPTAVKFSPLSGGPERGALTKPRQQSVLAGTGAAVVCRLSANLLPLAPESPHAIWSLPDGTALTADWSYTAMLSAFRSVNGTLHAANVTQADTGTYTCRLGNYTATARLQVYPPPGYGPQLGLVWTVNCCLALGYAVRLALARSICRDGRSAGAGWLPLRLTQQISGGGGWQTEYAAAESYGSVFEGGGGGGYMTLRHHRGTGRFRGVKPASKDA